MNPDSFNVTTIGQKTRTAKYWSPLRRIERHGSLLSTLSALHRNFDSLPHSSTLRCRNRSQPFILCLLAWLTTLRFVLETFVMKKDLFAGRPDKIFSAINTLDGTILVVGFGTDFRFPDGLDL